MILTDYINTMKVVNTPTPVKIIFFILVAFNIYFYKKHRINDELEDYLHRYPFTYGSLTFLIFGAFTFPTYGVDTFLYVFALITGLGVSISYLYNIYKEASNPHLNKKWLSVFGMISLEAILFLLIPHKAIAYTICLFLNLIVMMKEYKKRD